MGYYGHSKGNAIVITIVHRNHGGNHHKVHLRRHHFDDMGILGDCTAIWDTATNGDIGR